MVDPYTMGWILASVLGLIALYYLVVKNKNHGEPSPENESECVKSVAPINEECRSKKGDADVIIVGAGVAGSALAHTLGKVNFIVFCVRLFLIS